MMPNGTEHHWGPAAPQSAHLYFLLETKDEQVERALLVGSACRICANSAKASALGPECAMATANANK
jgi:hypothetical protein